MFRRVLAAPVLAAILVAVACGGNGNGNGNGNGPGAESFIADDAAIVSPESSERMDDLLGALLRDADVELVAATRRTLNEAPITERTTELFERWKVGDRSRGNRGVLLLIAAEEQLVRLEVSYGLEGILTDAFVSYVEHEQMVPYFARGRVGEGVEASVELVAGRLFEGILGSAYDPRREDPADVGGFRSGGAGADTRVPLNGESPPEAPAADASARARYAAQPTPELAWERFLELNRRRIKDTGLGIYDSEARAIVRRMNTNAGQDHIARTYGEAAATIRVKGDQAAVVFLDDPDHLLAPWFFHRTRSGWQFDGSMFPDIIGYNHRNQWHFLNTDHSYMFAFADFRLDRHGFAFHDSN
jgi:uncharacterized protein